MLCGTCLAMFRSGFQRCPADGSLLEPLRQDPFLEQVFAGRYVIEDFVGEGAMGRVYRARHTRMSKRFAVKIMFGDLAADAHMRARFSAEAEAASRLDHPNVVSVVDFGETSTGLIYMVMEFVEGKSLGHLIDEGPMEEPRVRRLVRDICLGLQHAHDRGLVHRDLKADNVMVVNNEGVEVPKLIDFGIAMLADAASGPGRLTAVGVVIGTPAYMSPEQACGERVDHRSDLFSLGLLTYEMLAGKKPFDGHPFEVARQNVAAVPPPIGERTKGVKVDPAFEDLVFQLLAKNRDQRPASAQAVVAVIDTLATPEGALERNFVVSSRGAPAFDQTALDLEAERPAIAGRSQGLILGGVAALLLLVGTVIFWPQPPPEGAVEPAPPPVAGERVAAFEQPVGQEEKRAEVEEAPSPEVSADAEAPAQAGEVEAEEEPAAGAEVTTAHGRRTERRKESAKRKGRGKGSEATSDEISLPPPPPPPAESKEIEASEVTRRYRLVSAALVGFSERKGKAAARAYEERMLAIAYAEALRNPALRPKVVAELERLEADLRRAR